MTREWCPPLDTFPLSLLKTLSPVFSRSFLAFGNYQFIENSPIWAQYSPQCIGTTEDFKYQLHICQHSKMKRGYSISGCSGMFLWICKCRPWLACSGTLSALIGRAVLQVFFEFFVLQVWFTHFSSIVQIFIWASFKYCSTIVPDFFKYFSIIAQVHFSNIVPSTMLSTLFGRPVCFKYSKPESVIDPCCPSHLDPCRLNTIFFGKLLFLTWFEQKHIFFSGCNCHFAIF